MIASISKSGINGAVAAPPSKSYTIRALMCAALAGGHSEIMSPLYADDTEAAIDVLGRVGVGITRESDSWLVSGGNLREPAGDLFCRDSAATLRFMTAVSALIPGRCRLTAGASLSRRPVQPLLQALGQLGVQCASRDGFPPVTVEGGPLKGGTVALSGNISSQFVSALLLVAPLCREGLSIKLTTALKSEPYVRMTLACQESFGVRAAAGPGRFIIAPQAYRPARYEVEGDWSSASYFLALGALCGQVTVKNLDPDSLQGDKCLLGLLRELGAPVTAGPGTVTVRRAKLRAIKADLADCIDLLPTAAVLAAAAEGTTVLTGIAAARLKESDRVAAVRDALARMGIETKENEDSFEITGGAPHGAVIDPRGDHRIAMAFSVLGTAAGDTTIEQAECVAKTFPEFWGILEKIGGQLTLDGQ
ncbi:MAG: 3-phosphoshikimate 1-carboxyvinyltransferase [Chloroflexi bacterium]|nr:3-phosphoshikimate 1-carboxyvinyltransferase [Chloroflexota bacterium]